MLFLLLYLFIPERLYLEFQTCEFHCISLGNPELFGLLFLSFLRGYILSFRPVYFITLFLETLNYLDFPLMENQPDPSVSVEMPFFAFTVNSELSLCLYVNFKIHKFLSKCLFPVFILVENLYGAVDFCSKV